MANLQLQDKHFAASATVAFQNKCVVPKKMKGNNLWLICPQGVKIDPAPGYTPSEKHYKDTSGVKRSVWVLEKYFKTTERFLMESSMWNYYIARKFGDTTRPGNDYESYHFMKKIQSAMGKKKYPTTNKYTTQDLINKFKTR